MQKCGVGQHDPGGNREAATRRARERARLAAGMGRIERVDGIEYPRGHRSLHRGIHRAPCHSVRAMGAAPSPRYISSVQTPAMTSIALPPPRLAFPQETTCDRDARHHEPAQHENGRHRQSDLRCGFPGGRSRQQDSQEPGAGSAVFAPQGAVSFDAMLFVSDDSRLAADFDDDPIEVADHEEPQQPDVSGALAGDEPVTRRRVEIDERQNQHV